jgi:hypothetical protein
MKMFNNRTIRAYLLSAAAMLIALGTFGIGATSASAAHRVPFRGSYSGRATFASDGTLHFSGTGFSALLGKGTNEGHVVFTSGTPGCAGGLPNDNYETLIGASGDSLMIVSHDVACPVGPNQYHGTGNWVVTGGTGRFSNATGAGTLDGKSDLANGTFTFQLTGNISAPNGK